MKFKIAHSVIILIRIFVFLMIANFDVAASNTQWHDDSCIFSGVFTEEQTEKDSLAITISSGSFFYDCESGVIWNTEQTNISTKILTIENIHYHVDENNHLRRLKSIADSLQARLLLSFLAGDAAFIDDNFSVEDDGQLALSLTPKTRSYKRGLRNIIINKSTQNEGSLVIKILDKRGQSTIMTISQSRVYEPWEKGDRVCRKLYETYEYCNILINPGDFQSSIDR